jgi:two-component system cell cycle response regulator
MMGPGWDPRRSRSDTGYRAANHSGLLDSAVPGGVAAPTADAEASANARNDSGNKRAAGTGAALNVAGAAARPEATGAGAKQPASASDADFALNVEATSLLIADDDAIARGRVERAVREWGYTPTVVEDGATALARLSVHGGPKLAILDWEMPGLSGPQVVRIVRSRPAAPYIYLILLTSRGARENLVEGLSAGADDYVLKPFDPIELRLRLSTGRRIVKLQQELIEARQELEQRANHDALTGAVNRGAMLNKIEEEASRSQRQMVPFCIVLFDLDFFKRVNDTYGHRTGDEVLKETVQRVNQALRPYDVLGRYGGEEFIVLLPGCDLDDGAVVAERLRERVASTPYLPNSSKLNVSASFGLVCSSLGHTTLEGMIDAADKALYKAKANGRNRIERAQRATSSGAAAPMSLRTGATGIATGPVGSIAVPHNVQIGPISSRAPDDGRWSLGPVLDRAVLMQVQELIDDDPEFLEQLFDKYLSSADSAFEVLLSEQPMTEKWRVTHTLRSGSQSIGAGAVAEVCQRLEKVLRGEQNPKLDEWVDTLKAQVERVRERYPLELARMLSSKNND